MVFAISIADGNLFIQKVRGIDVHINYSSLFFKLQKCCLTGVEYFFSNFEFFAVFSVIGIERKRDIGQPAFRSVRMLFESSEKILKSHLQKDDSSR